MIRRHLYAVLAAALLALSAAPPARSATGEVNVGPLQFSFTGGNISFFDGSVSGEVETDLTYDVNDNDGTLPLTVSTSDPSTGATASVTYTPPGHDGTLSASATAPDGPGSPFGLSFVSSLFAFTTDSAGTFSVTGAYSLLADPGSFGYADAGLGVFVAFEGATLLESFDDICACAPGGPASKNGSFSESYALSGAGTGFFAIASEAYAEGGMPAAIPEPSTYALMLTGLGIVAFAVRRRPKNRPATS